MKNKNKIQASRLEELKEKFKDYKLTAQRKLILQVFLENEDQHLSAEEVLKLVHQQDSNVGFATVYRNLDLLNKLGILYRIDLEDGKSRYELNTSESHQHHHLICIKCHKIIEVKWDLLHRLESKIESEHDFKILEHQVKFYGYCHSCKL